MSPRRVPELDSLRGLAAIGIILFHYTYPSRAHDLVFYTGAASLELFFVLSGFLITSIIITNCENEKFLSNFYVRRGLRIYPIYYLLIFGLVVIRWFRPEIYSLRGLPYYLTYTQHVQRYWSGQEPPMIYPLSHTWSLAVEEQFYIIWPVLIRLLGRRMVIPLSVVFIASALAARAYGFSPQILIGRSDGFAMGSLLAALLAEARARPAAAWAYRLALALTGFLALSYLTWGMVLTGQKPFDTGNALAIYNISVINAFVLAVVGLVVCYAGHPFLGVLRTGPLCYVGKISYGLYLYHLPLMVFLTTPIRAVGVENRWGMVAIEMLACFALSALSWSAIEQPILSIKDRFRYGATPGKAPSRDLAVPAVEPATQPL
jgi:peptidoglycan/LPS O-acetylase OafA/YrhL